MKKQIDAELQGIIEWIKEIDERITAWQKFLPDPSAAFTIWQFEDLKKDFVRQLLAALVESNLSVSDLEPFLQNATSYLKKFDRSQQHVPGELKKNLAEVEQMLTGREIEMPALEAGSLG